MKSMRKQQWYEVYAGSELKGWVPAISEAQAIKIQKGLEVGAKDKKLKWKAKVKN